MMMAVEHSKSRGSPSTPDAWQSTHSHPVTAEGLMDKAGERNFKRVSSHFHSSSSYGFPLTYTVFMIDVSVILTLLTR